MKRINSNKQINELLSKYMSDEYELKIVSKDENKKLSFKEQERLKEELNVLYEKIKEKIGNHIYFKPHAHDYGAHIDFEDFEYFSQLYIKNRPIVINGKEIGLTCEFCNQKLRCLNKEDGQCVEDESVQRNVEKKLKEKFNLKLERKQIEYLLQNEGFKREQPIKGKLEYENIWIKGKMTIYV